MNIKKGPIDGVILTTFRKFVDERGWLAEIFRHDELPDWFRPEMAYVSVTRPGVLRGPHEHVDQADLFCWVGPGDFKVSLWDNRPTSPTYGNRMEFAMGVNNPGSSSTAPTGCSWARGSRSPSMKSAMRMIRRIP